MLSVGANPRAERHDAGARWHNLAESSITTPGNSEAVPVAPVLRTDPILQFPKKKSKDSIDSKYNKFVKVLKSLNVNIPFTYALTEMPAYAKILKDILAKKRLILELVDECNSVPLSHQCNALNKNNLPVKLNDPGRFAITISLGNRMYKSLCDLGANTSLLPLSIWKDINMRNLQPVKMNLYMADESCVQPT